MSTTTSNCRRYFDKDNLPLQKFQDLNDKHLVENVNNRPDERTNEPSQKMKINVRAMTKTQETPKTVLEGLVATFSSGGSQKLRRKALPFNIHGNWSKSHIVDKDLKQKILIHLQGIRKMTKPCLRVWSLDGKDKEVSTGQKLVFWFYDESTFYKMIVKENNGAIFIKRLFPSLKAKTMFGFACLMEERQLVSFSKQAKIGKCLEVQLQDCKKSETGLGLDW
ncbi:hypothetical protein B0H34DRAFT_678149 [Crassisporium funariophilum]|nr:hypothetical protein B0H34DRAFT_678149 [Crassisporium funariophilum]